MSNPSPRPLPSWDVLCPNGRWVFYEGKDHNGFAADMIAEFDFDPRLSDPDSWNQSGSFFIPAGKVEAVYGSGRWPLGS